MTKLLLTSEASQADVDRIVDMQLDIDLRDNTFTSLVEMEHDLKELSKSKNIQEEVVVDTPSMKLINGHGKSARLISRQMVDLVCNMAKKNGIGLVSLYNSTYHSIMEYNAREIAAQDLIGIVLANGGPKAVAPYGGGMGVTGTNPLSYAFPSTKDPIVFDAATAKYAFGTIKIAKRKGKKLPSDGYFNSKGKPTTDPHQAEYIASFGKHKGYAINLMCEVLTGALTRSVMGLKQTGDSTELGSTFMAIDPSVFRPIDQFKADVSDLIKDLQSIKPLPGFDQITVPGIGNEQRKQQRLKQGWIEVENVAWEIFKQTYQQHFSKTELAKVVLI